MTPPKRAKEVQGQIDDLLSEVFKRHDVFFAFSEAQVEEQKKEGIEYAYNRSLNMFYNIKSRGKVIKEMEAAVDEGIALDKQLNTKEQIIIRELLNYECFYTGSPADAIEKLEDYDYTKEEVVEVFKKYFNYFMETLN